MGLGEGEHGASWTAQAIALLEEHGPFKLAFLETLIRIADWRGSARHAPSILEQTDA
jgi:CRISPR-associated endonuclease/helicase Cas3